MINLMILLIGILLGILFSRLYISYNIIKDDNLSKTTKNNALQWLEKH